MRYISIGIAPCDHHSPLSDRRRYFLHPTDAGYTIVSNLKKVLANTERAADLEGAEKLIMRSLFVAGPGLRRLSGIVLPVRVVKKRPDMRGWYMREEEMERAIFEDAVKETVSMSIATE